MNKKIYMKPETECVQVAHIQLLNLSEGKDIEIPVNPNGEEINAGNSLSRRKSIWSDDDWE